jgi:hypothetical protein
MPAAALDQPALHAALAWGLDEGLLEQRSVDRLVLTVTGRLLADELFVRLL